jgi:hypothetical protein
LQDFTLQPARRRRVASLKRRELAALHGKRGGQYGLPRFVTAASLTTAGFGVRIALRSGKSLRMDTGQWLTRGTIWLALTLYVAGEIVSVALRGNQSERVARVLNSVGCAAFVAHVGCAFHFHHHWSHAAAYAETARQTAAYFGWEWGGGIYFNYALLLLWLSYAILSWTNPLHSRLRPGWTLWIGRSFILMMMVNGAVIFAHGPVRWFGLFLCAMLLLCWWPRRAHIRPADVKVIHKPDR